MSIIRKAIVLLAISAAVGAATSSLYVSVSTPGEVWRAYSEWHEKRTPDAKARLEWLTETGERIRHLKLAALHTVLWFIFFLPFCFNRRS